VYDKGVDVKKTEDIYRLLVQYRSGEMFIPTVENLEALQLETEYFVECLKSNKKPVNDGEAGLRVVKILEASNKSLKNGGMEVKI